MQAWVGDDDAGEFGERFAGGGLQIVLAESEEHVGHIDLEAARRVGSRKHAVKLREKRGAKLLLLQLGLSGGVLCLLCTCLRGSGSLCGLQSLSIGLSASGGLLRGVAFGLKTLHLGLLASG